ncbi:hypothetical protein JTE90_021124 [Oedothorax gibbosus]|uniref:Uncharacterized protein n=1 Tax=Oedothorax gibbosus TaxID=931172 RepID=A0AAV6TCY5_9ARAC|nr:hypothetical protein JTE90_021124 [Oedothorax gibbosus]
MKPSHLRVGSADSTLNIVTQPFRVIFWRSIDPGEALPAHVCNRQHQAHQLLQRYLLFSLSERKTTTDCTPSSVFFQCYDLICVDAAQVCDAVPDCIDGEDEDQDCDKIPESGAVCTLKGNKWVGTAAHRTTANGSSAAAYP